MTDAERMRACLKALIGERDEALELGRHSRVAAVEAELARTVGSSCRVRYGAPEGDA